MPVMNSPNIAIASRSVIKCCCGKICKGMRGVKMHQRSCRVILGLNNELCTDLEEQIDDNSANIPTDDQSNTSVAVDNEESSPILKNGINLPKSDSEWSTANSFFKSVLQLNGPIRSHDLNPNIKLLNDVIYNYFADNFGHVKTVPDENLVNKHKDHSVKDLKKALKNLKSANGDSEEIQYVSHTLRDKLRRNSNNCNRSMINTSVEISGVMSKTS